MRMLHELTSHEDSIFITLTYSDHYLPDNGSLDKRALQLFIKRLRKSLGDRKIRYFACGEYGDKTQRPHYHAIVFGLSLRLEDKQLIKNAWPYGLCHYGLAEPDSIRYVAQYIDKKFTGDMADVEYNQKNREPVFRLMSLGLGREFVDSNADNITSNCYVTVRGVKMSLPRYYAERLNIDKDELKAKALEISEDLVESKLGISGLNRDVAYHALAPEDVIKLEEGIKASKQQTEATLNAKIALKRSKI